MVFVTNNVVFLEKCDFSNTHIGHGITSQNTDAAVNSCRIDVWNSFMVSDSVYAGEFEIPVLYPTYQIPNRVITFSKSFALFK